MTERGRLARRKPVSLSVAVMVFSFCCPPIVGPAVGARQTLHARPPREYGAVKASRHPAAAPTVGGMSASPVVVITGASSGLGRGTAVEFAKRHARLVLVARGATALQDVAAECTAKGARDVVTVA